MENESNVMIDIETLGKEPGCVILSVAAVRFNIVTGAILENIHLNAIIESNEEVGLKIDGDTVLWWLQQSDEARAGIFNGQSAAIHIGAILESLNTFIDKDDHVWANSPRFDLGILKAAYNACNINIGWDHRKEMCVRTLDNIFPEIRKSIKKEGVSHNPIDDCIHQIKYTVAIWKLIHN